MKNPIEELIKNDLENITGNKITVSYPSGSMKGYTSFKIKKEKGIKPKFNISDLNKLKDKYAEFRKKGKMTFVSELSFDFYVDPKKSEIQKEASEHAGTFEKIQEGEIKTPEDLGESISEEHHMEMDNKQLTMNNEGKSCSTCNHSETTPESFSDCLKRNGINLEKDHHRFEVGTLITGLSGKKYKVHSFDSDHLYLAEIFDFGTQSVEPMTKVPYNEILEKFKNGNISVSGFESGELMEFARVLNTIQHCAKMEKLAMDNEKLRDQIKFESEKLKAKEEAPVIIEEIITKEKPVAVIEKPDNKETIKGLKTLLSLTTDKEEKKKIRVEIKKLTGK